MSIKELYENRERASSFDALVEYHQMNFDLLRTGDLHPAQADAGNRRPDHRADARRFVGVCSDAS
jgi:hypothetical protein